MCVCVCVCGVCVNCDDNVLIVSVECGLVVNVLDCVRGQGHMYVLAECIRVSCTHTLCTVTLYPERQLGTQ